MEERQNDFELPQLINNETNLKIIEIFGIKGKNLKTLGSVVEEALKTYDYKYVLYSAEYTMINAKVSLLKYFKDTLANNWADEYIAKKIVLEEKKEPLKKSIRKSLGNMFRKYVRHLKAVVKNKKKTGV